MSCQVNIPENPTAADQRLTVGKEFFLTCQIAPDIDIKGLDFKTAHFKLPEEMKYALKILDVQLQENAKKETQLQIKVTSYSAASVKILDLLMDIGSTEITLGPLEFQVQSLLQELQQKVGPDKKIEAYGPFGPVKVPWPLWSWSSLAIILTILLMAFIRKYYLVSQKKKLIQQAPYLKSLDPLVEFEKNLRKLAQETVSWEEGARQLDRFWRLYWTRCFLFPALDWSERKLLKDFKKNYTDIYLLLEKEIRSFVFEMRNLKKNNYATNEVDYHKLIRMNRETIEKIDHAKLKFLRNAK